MSKATSRQQKLRKAVLNRPPRLIEVCPMEPQTEEAVIQLLRRPGFVDHVRKPRLVSAADTARDVAKWAISPEVVNRAGRNRGSGEAC